MTLPIRIAIPALLLAATAAAQQPASDPAQTVPAVGDMAPDVALQGATRYGLIEGRPMLSQYRGQTVVLAFFVAARTRG